MYDSLQTNENVSYTQSMGRAEGEDGAVGGIPELVPVPDSA